MNDTLLGAVVDLLTQRRISFALIGAAALAAHGVGRSTFDIDLLLTDRSVLEPGFWLELQTPSGVAADARSGDADDPLAGVVRLTAPGQRVVDLVVGRGGWQETAINRAEPTSVFALTVPVVTVPDLIALKLYAGGSQDAWDIEQLLAAGDAGAIRTAVDALQPSLPLDARQLWERIKQTRR